VLVTIVIIVVVLVAAAVVLYAFGFGIPTQESDIETLFNDPDAAATEVFSPQLDSETIASMTAAVIPDPNATIDSMDRSMSESVAYVTATTDEGGSLNYRITLVRDFIGWKISNVELYFPSQNV
ncbi:MAG: hypothetical protein LUB61_06750, partial [Eggerthellaceae bacterium]|nr:hypothetical protein [Eggerthellaceae bacterium]